MLGFRLGPSQGHLHARVQTGRHAPGTTTTFSACRRSRMASAQAMPCRRSHRNMPAAGGVQLAKPPRCSCVPTACSIKLAWGLHRQRCSSP